MKKRSFRERKPDVPDYPRLKDLDAGALRKWGLLAVGGLLLGGAACKQPPPPAGVQPMNRNEELAARMAAQARAAQPIDAGGPAAPYLGPPGEPPMDRAELDKAKPEAGKKLAKPAMERNRRAGPIPPRLEEKKPGKK
jgi:hypothetical protein